MKILKIDRTATTHGEYNATISLKFDELVRLSNALYCAVKYMKADKTLTYSDREIKKAIGDKQDFDVLMNLTCHGHLMESDIKDISNMEDKNNE